MFRAIQKSRKNKKELIFKVKVKRMLEILRTNSENSDFIDLVKLLDADLAKRDGDEHAFYSQFNSIHLLKYCIVLYEDNIPISCGAIKKFDMKRMEVKRMYTVPNIEEKVSLQKAL